MTPTELSRVGEALFGARWQTEMALAVGVADRTVRRWAAGDTAVPSAIVPKLVAALKRRRGDLRRELRELDRIEADLGKAANAA